MIIKTKGIILRTVKYSETSVIADILTEAKGLKSYIVSGVRTHKAKIPAGMMQVMSIVDLVAYNKEDKALNRVKEMRFAVTYYSIPFDMQKTAVGLFMIEVTRRAIREEEENPDLAHLVFQVFTFLDESNHFVNLHIAYLLELSSVLGFRPHEEDCENGALFDLKEGVFKSGIIGHTHFLDANLSSILRGFLSTHFSENHTVKLTRQERRALLDALVQYFRFHIDGFPEINSQKILQEIL